MAENKDEPNTEDIVADEEELEEALCVLAGSDPNNCSYSRGYVKRQAVFACSTCTPSTAEPAGVCLACANKCHEGHEIFELYTKRNFRCDCGNGKFGDFECQLIPARDNENNKNSYNHNFHGCYCTCDRPYPDADDQVNDEMIQCVTCEDWFHTRHLGCAMVEPEELQEMVCESCMSKAPFLWTYAAHFAVPPVVSVSHPEEDVEVDVEEGSDKEDDSEPSQTGDEEPSTSLEHTKQEEVTNRRSPCKRTHEEMTGSPGKATSKSEDCRLKELQAQGLERPREGAVFWPYSWRSKLCTCTSCKRAYVAVQVQFLMDQADTILAYENKGLDEPFGQHPLMALTSSLNHVQQLEVIYGYNELTTVITAFLEKCAAEGKTVTAEAVHQYFEELRARKRRRTNAGYQ
ncbi:putative E3 ubiquitin-protein ligase UBR7 [Scomber scombrus]|uniref:Putative E3 ubiquitin-protein ligase UBR7 n=1 Tax=Scomber scombrus TaxID=13677 RepID=A0AAV1ND35_SCOSC|nr:putative E3 ubiquitin-protein ligase UBR7 [Scomber scombrus]